MWKTKNYKGESITWYSEEEYNVLKQEIEEKEKIIENLEWECKKLINECEELQNEKAI